MKPGFVQTQWWRYKTTVVIKRQQNTISKKCRFVGSGLETILKTISWVCFEIIKGKATPRVCFGITTLKIGQTSVNLHNDWNI